MRNLLLLRFLRPLAPLGWAIVRFVAGAMLAMHGLEKLRNGPAGFARHLASLDVPMPEVAAWTSTLGELVGGGLMALGLFTRPAGLVVAINMAVAIALSHTGDFGKIGTGAGGVVEYPLLLCAVGVGALLQGGGPVSLDRATVERSVPPAPSAAPPPRRY